MRYHHTMRPLSRDIPDWLADLAPLTVMDAQCALCSFGARMIHRVDRSGTVRILPIQTERGQAALTHFGLAPDDPETWLYIDGAAASTGFEAMILLGARCGGWGHVLAPLRVLPGPARRQLYRAIARNRYRLFGRADLCGLPDAGLRARLLS